jgi:uncharacterized protein (DUF2267 family)
MKPLTLYRRVVVEADLETVEEGKRATAAVLHALRDRLTRTEGRHAVAQLPRELKTMWAEAAAPPRPIKMHKALFYERVKAEAGFGTLREARAATAAVFGGLKTQLSPGEAGDVAAQLPKDLKWLWEDA